MSQVSQIDELCRGVVDLVVKAELEERLASGRPLRIKAGFDPTRPDLHIGHTVLMQKMRQFQDFGHEIVFLIGDFTAMVGDPTGKSESRPRLTREDVRSAAESYATQAFKVLDKDRTVVRYNSEWLDKLSPSDVIELGAKYTVARMMERDDFKKRFEENRAIHIHEFYYPLFQAYDSVALECDVELGGTDQLFNLLVGRDLMPRYGKRGQIVMTTPILEGTDARLEGGKVVGAKMSKSANNYIGVSEPPFEMLQKLMLIGDEVIFRFMGLLSEKSLPEMKQLEADVAAGRLEPKSVKEAFAIEVVTRFHDADAARTALARRQEVSAGKMPDDTEEVCLSAEGGELSLAKALCQAGLAKSNSEATRLIQQGGVLLDDRKLGAAEAFMKLAAPGRYAVRVGSKNRKFAWLKID